MMNVPESSESLSKLGSYLNEAKSLVDWKVMLRSEKTHCTREISESYTTTVSDGLSSKKEFKFEYTQRVPGEWRGLRGVDDWTHKIYRLTVTTGLLKKNRETFEYASLENHLEPQRSFKENERMEAPLVGAIHSLYDMDRRNSERTSHLGRILERTPQEYKPP